MVDSMVILGLLAVGIFVVHMVVFRFYAPALSGDSRRIASLVMTIIIVVIWAFSHCNYLNSCRV